MSPLPPDLARAEVCELVPLRETFARQLGEVRLQLCEAGGSPGQLYEKALRYERLVGRIENRIRVAMLSLALREG
jgi:hypothetical protein